MPRLHRRLHPVIAVFAILLTFSIPTLLSAAGPSAARRPSPGHDDAPLALRDARLSRRLSALLRGRDAQDGFWGVYVYSLDRHRVVFAHNADLWFEPASNAKLFTLATALQLIGPDYRYHTVVASAAAPDPAGVIDGDVTLIGSGDPSLSGRPYPYRYQPDTAARLAAPPYDMMAAARDLAEQLRRRGITRIHGDVVGDDRYFDWEPYPPGWSVDNLIDVYGAPVSALTMNDNRRAVLVRPGAHVGDPARLTLDPAVGGPPLDNRVVTGPADGGNYLSVVAEPLDAGVLVEGSVALGGDGREIDIAVPDPALYAAQLLRQALIDAGIQVDGVARARHRAPGRPVVADPHFILAQRTSPPLNQIMQTTAKVSQDLHAELILRLLGKLRGDPDATNDRLAGERVVQSFLHQAGLGPRDAELVDGSGLSRLDLVTPAGIVRLLEYMDRQPDRAVWQSLFPIAGEDGTLAHRFVGTIAAGRLRAKTGTLTHVNCLSGYVTTRAGEHLAFAMLADNQVGDAIPLLDRLALALAQ